MALTWVNGSSMQSEGGGAGFPKGELGNVISSRYGGDFITYVATPCQGGNTI